MTNSFICAETHNSTRPKLPLLPPPPLPPMPVSLQEQKVPQIDDIIIDALSAPSKESSLNFALEVTFEKVTLSSPVNSEKLSDVQSNLDQPKVTGDQAKATGDPKVEGQPSNDDTNNDNEQRGESGTEKPSDEPDSRVKGETKPTLQRQSSFKRYERKLSFRRPSVPGTSSIFPPYEDTR